ncbi:MAG: bifunctional glutamate N-acetyltransferase/amino-acid acetyltransferase ArgJ [Candidatus Omnitrophica bacterium]|nr:bifunctional glutamate N-acetyltransferase/amino-acid acetyltransferase ArgJ [Candidatus Omnitrophota bacterium]
MTKVPFEKRRGGTVTTPLGFLASGIRSGIKQKKKYDSALIVSENPAIAAGTFTLNRAKAWPVIYSMKAIHGARHRGILASSGNANCFNGAQGKAAVADAVASVAHLLKVSPEEILIAQTGLIGVPFPINRFKRGLPKLVERLSPDGGKKAAKGILTTDLRTKEVALSFHLGKKRVTIGAVAKGAGMVHPNMATMLCFITTDVKITKRLLRRALRRAVDETFNRLAIDNDQSTNDTVLILANGQAGNHTIARVDRRYRLFRDALEEVCRYVARELVRGGEGVTKVCTLHISGAKRPTDAEKVARQIGTSMLFKTMLAGADPNWGRLVAAIGASGVDFDSKRLDISFDGVFVLSHGKLRVSNLPKARRVLQKREFDLNIGLGKGHARAEFITSDLTPKYVLINSSYSS